MKKQICTIHIVLNYFECGCGTQVSDMLDRPTCMSKFHKLSMTKCSHRQPTEKLLGFQGSNVLNTPK